MTSRSSTNPEVLIVGAGPVGLVAAVDLARRHVPVRIIDRLEEPTDQSRAVVLHARSLELMDQLGVLEDIDRAGIRTTGAAFHAHGALLGRVSFDSIDSPFPHSVTLPQTDTERILTARLGELGVTVERGVMFTRLEQDEHRVLATLTRPDGSTETADVAWVIGTDGASSAVRGSVGLELEGSFKGERFLMGDVDADYSHDRSALHIFFSPGEAVGMLFPMADRRVRVICQIPNDTPATRTPSIEWLQECIDERGMQLSIDNPRWLTIFEIHHAQVPRYRTGRVFLAGDAAHIHSPAGGLGMNTGIQDAFNLSWKIAAAVHGSGGNSLLDSYHEERHPVAAEVISFSTNLTRAGTLRSPFARELRNVILRAALATPMALHAMANEVEQMTVDYRLGPLAPSRHHGAVRVGDALRAVPGVDLWAAVAHAEPSPSGHTAVLVASADGVLPHYLPPDGVRTIRVTATSGTGDVTDPDRAVARRYGLGDTGGFILVRPDGYLAAVSTPDASADIDAYLATITG